MDEIRLKRLENDVTTLNRRVTDHDTMHANTLALLDAMKKTTDSHEEMVNIAREVIDLLKQLIKYLSWVGVVAKWVSTIAVAFTATWHATKWVIAKMGMFQ